MRGIHLVHGIFCSLLILSDFISLHHIFGINISLICWMEPTVQKEDGGGVKNVWRPPCQNIRWSQWQQYGSSHKVSDIGSGEGLYFAVLAPHAQDDTPISNCPEDDIPFRNPAYLQSTLLIDICLLCWQSLDKKVKSYCWGNKSKRLYLRCSVSLKLPH